MKPSLRVSKITGLLILLLVINACAPFPHYEIVSPAISGKVHRNGKPIENAMVYFEYPIGDTESCSFESEFRTRTNGEGHFDFELRKEFSFFVFMDRWTTWQICIVNNGARYQGWYEHQLGGPTPEVTLDCNLESKPHVRQRGTLLKTKGICSSSSKYN